MPYTKKLNPDGSWTHEWTFGTSIDDEYRKMMDELNNKKTIDLEEGPDGTWRVPEPEAPKGRPYSVYIGIDPASEHPDKSCWTYIGHMWPKDNKPPTIFTGS